MSIFIDRTKDLLGNCYERRNNFEEQSAVSGIASTAKKCSDVEVVAVFSRLALGKFFSWELKQVGMSQAAAVQISRSDQWHAVTASFLGWTLDAFDFFVLVFLLDTLAQEFHVTKADMIRTITATLAMRPVGALLFGLLADRYGRRIPLMLNVVFFSLVELLCGFAPNYTVFLILRTLYGIGMGGEWGSEIVKLL